MINGRYELVGLVVALAIAIGAVVNASPIADRLGDPGAFGPFAGTWLQVLGLLIALVAGAVATTALLRRR